MGWGLGDGSDKTGQDSSFQMGQANDMGLGGQELIAETFVQAFSSLCTCSKHCLDECFVPLASF